MVAGTVYRATWTYLAASGIPEDAITNTWHFATTQVAGIDFVNMKDMLEDFYELGTTSGTPVRGYLSQELSGAYELDVYHLTDPSPRVPVYQATGNTGVSATARALPREVACRVSLQAAPQSGVAPSRLRGGPYIGPFCIDALALTGGGPAESFLTVMSQATDRLIEAADASVTWDLVVYSTQLAGSPGDGARANKVVTGYVDNAWDTQRRRGKAATSRTTFGL